MNKSIVVVFKAFLLTAAFAASLGLAYGVLTHLWEDEDGYRPTRFSEYVVMQEWVPTNEHMVKILAVYLIVLLLTIIYVKRLLGLLFECPVAQVDALADQAPVDAPVEARKSWLLALLAWFKYALVEGPVEALLALDRARCALSAWLSVPLWNDPVRIRILVINPIIEPVVNGPEHAALLLDQMQRRVPHARRPAHPAARGRSSH